MNEEPIGIPNQWTLYYLVLKSDDLEKKKWLFKVFMIHIGSVMENTVKSP